MNQDHIESFLKQFFFFSIMVPKWFTNGINQALALSAWAVE